MIVYNGIPFTLAAAASSSQMFAPAAVPGSQNQHIAPSIKIYLKFRTKVAGQLLGISFYKSTLDTGNHPVILYDASGNILASVANPPSETASGWQTSLFQAPVTIAANTDYYAARRSQFGYYASDPNVFTSPLTIGNFLIGVNASHIRILPGTAGFYWAGAFDSVSDDPTNYYIDVIFLPSGTAGTTFNWSQISGPATSIFSGANSQTVTITAPQAGSYVYQCAASDGIVTNNQQTTVAVSAIYTSTKSFTANCAAGTAGNSVTRSATYTSIISQLDADTNALAEATTAANAAIRCDPVQGFIGWRVVIPNLSNFTVGSLSAQYQIQLKMAVLNSGTPAAPKTVTYLATQTLAGTQPNNIIDLSNLFSGFQGAQTFYLWPQLQLTINGVTVVTQLPSNAISLDYVAPVGGASSQTVRFRDVETLSTNYQGYASAFALTVNNTNFAAVQLTLNLGNAWDVFSLNTHGWDDLVYGNKPNRGYNRLVLSSLSGTPAAPLRETVLGVFQPTYNHNDPYDFANNRLSFSPFFAGAQNVAYYVLRRARTLTADALSFDPNDKGIRFESSLNFFDYTSPTLTLPQATIGNLAENDAASIVAGPNVAVTFTPFPGNPAITAFPVPRFSLSSFKWKNTADPYTHVIVVTISGSPSVPTGILNQYSFALSDPTVLDGPLNLLLALQEFDTVSGWNSFTPFTAVFYSAVYNPVPNTYTLFASSFPILNNARVVNGNPTFTVNTFVGYQSFPVAANGAVSFTGTFAYGETLYNNRVNNGTPFTP